VTSCACTGTASEVATTIPANATSDDGMLVSSCRG
jgi:hypothetical protein